MGDQEFTSTPISADYTPTGSSVQYRQDDPSVFTFTSEDLQGTLTEANR